MHNRKVVACLLAVAALVACGPTLSAAEPRRPSHRPIGSGAALDETELAQRLQATQDLSALVDLAEKIQKNPDKFPKLNDARRKALLEKFLKDPDKKRLLNDPQMQELFRDAMKNQKLSDEQLKELGKQLDKLSPEDLRKLAEEANKNPGDFKLDDQEREQLRQLAERWKAGQKPADLDRLRDLMNKAGQNPHLPPDDLDALRRTLPADPGPMPPMPPDPIIPPDGPPIGPDQQPLTNPPTPAPPPATGDEPSSGWTDSLTDLLDNLDPDGEWGGKVVDWVRDMIDDDSDSSPVKAALRDTVDWITSLDPSDWLPSDDTRKSVGSWFNKVSPPSGGRSGGGSSSSGGLGTGTGFLNADQLAGFFIGLAALAILGVAAWRLRMWYTGAGAGSGRAARWPVRPDAVATRGDLVRAFEYLALFLLGVDARHRHHLDLADRLGGPSPEPADARRQAANHLAYLYELARYAPEDEPLPEADLAAARRDLSFLAGAGAA